MKKQIVKPVSKNVKAIAKPETKKQTVKKSTFKPAIVKEKSKIKNLSDVFVIFSQLVENVLYMITVDKKSEEHTRPFAIVSKDNGIIRQESKDITALFAFFNLDVNNAEWKDKIFSDVTRKAKGIYKLNPLYTGILYPLCYRHDKRIEQGLNADNYARMLNRFMSNELTAMIAQDFNLSDKRENNMLHVCDPASGIVTFDVCKTNKKK